MDDIIYIVEDVRTNGGNPIIVIPPVHESIWEYVIRPLELEGKMSEYKTILVQHATLYDGEWLSDFAKEQDIFTNGFHFEWGDGYQRFEDAIFMGNDDILTKIPYQPSP